MASRYHFEAEKPSFGGQLGASLGTGLGKSLTALAEGKLNKMIANDKRSQDKQRLVALGIPEHEAEYASHQDAEKQWEIGRAWLIAGGVPEEKLPKSLKDEWNVDPQEEEAAQQQVKQMMAQQQGQQGPAGALQQLGQPQQQQPGMAQALGMQQAQAPQRPKGIGEALKIAKAKDSGKDFELEELKKEKLRKDIKGNLSEDAKLFVQDTENKAKLARPLLKELNIIEDYIDENEKEISTDILSANAPDSFLNRPTKELRRKMSAFLNKLIQIESSGRGSDLLRKVIQEGKLNLQQGPEVWREALNELRDEQQDNLRLSELKDEIRHAYGKTPEDISGIARDQLAVESTEFKSLPDEEKIVYLFNNPNKMKWITELNDESGKVIARRTKNGWKML